MSSAEYQREWKKRNPGKQVEYNQRWNKKNPGKAAKASRRWYHENKAEYGPTRHRKNKTPEQLEKLKAQDRVQSEKHKDKRHAYTREWCKRNKEHRREYNNRWYKTPQGLAHARRHNQNRRARKLKAEGSFTAEDIKDLYATQGGRCYYCSVDLKEGYHIDHMTPLIRGGRNDVSNLCLACPRCNLRKHTKTAEEFQNALAAEYALSSQDNHQEQDQEKDQVSI